MGIPEGNCKRRCVQPFSPFLLTFQPQTDSEDIPSCVPSSSVGIMHTHIYERSQCKSRHVRGKRKMARQQAEIFLAFTNFWPERVLYLIKCRHDTKKRFTTKKKEITVVRRSIVYKD